MTDLIKTRLLIILLLTSVSVSQLAAQSTVFPVSIITGNPTEADFQLVTNQHHASIMIDEQDYPLVKLSAGLFRDDVERESGYRPSLLTNQ